MNRRSIVFSFAAIMSFTIIPGLCLGQNSEGDVKSRPNEMTHASQSIRGIYITGNESGILKGGRTGVSGVQVENLQAAGDPETLKMILQRYIGKEANKTELTDILKDITHYYRTNKLTAVSVKVFPKAPNGVVQILISQKLEKPALIKGIYLTGKQEEILKEGRKDVSDVQLSNLQISGEKELKAAIQPYIGKEMTSEQLKDLGKQIVLFYRTQHLPPITVKFRPQKKSGVVQVLIAAKPKKPKTIKGIFITGSEADILKEGRQGITDVQLTDLKLPGMEEKLKADIQPFIGKEITKEQLTELQKKIALFYQVNKLPPILVKVRPKRTTGVIQVLVSAKPKGQTIAKKGVAKKGGKKIAAKAPSRTDQRDFYHKQS